MYRPESSRASSARTMGRPEAVWLPAPASPR